MTDEAVEQPVSVTDNGVRSFLPPTFCFDLHDRSGILVATVSGVAWPQAGLADFEAVARLTVEGLRATGVVSEYDAGPQARTSGRRFLIRDTTTNGI
ncbi:SAM domain-containing protein [Streptomyces johnsoniae]|uniref:Uncharacterized protein n=1 Tax=Streptomyces johnsoniae TaxID=3075532 RepID=A0ABU2S3H4_9ACTN|nr:hypothetical protein [Streptomyces sp. DSM 41886]MDT0443517.1 hypothetical protein [Streptomyces sp. DSM 41886]